MQDSSPAESSRSFPSSPPIFRTFNELLPSLPHQLPRPVPSHPSNLQLTLPAHKGICLSLPIGSEDLLDLLLAACQRAEEENVAEIGETVKSDSEVEENMAFTGATMSSDDSFLYEDNTNSEDNYTDNKEND